MKSPEKNFDELIKQQLSDIEIQPPAPLKKQVFGKLAMLAFFRYIKRNSLFVLLLLMISVLGIFSYNASRETGSDPKENNGYKSSSYKTDNENDNTAAQKNQDITFDEKKSDATHNENTTHNSNSNTNNNTQDLADNTTGSEKNIQPETEHSAAKTAVAPAINNSQKRHDDNLTSNLATSASGTPTEILPEYENNDHTQGNNLAINKSGTALQETSNAAASGVQEINKTTGYSPNVRTEFAISEMLTLPGLIDTENSLKVSYPPAPVNKMRQPLSWSVGMNIGHSLLQYPLTRLPENRDDDTYSYSSTLYYPSITAGIDIRAEKRHLFFEAGVQYALFTENIKSDNVLINPQNHQFYNFTGQTMNVDTGGGSYHYFWICDSVPRLLDSVWTWKIDTTYLNLYDTVNTKVYDTLHHPEWRNSYTFIELPLSVGWQYNFGRLNVGIKTGPIMSLLVGTKGFVPSGRNEQAYMNTLDSEFKKFSMGLSWHIATMVSYLINERILLECQPYYRMNLKSISTSSGYAMKNNSLGITVGVRYFF
ncbi:MAG TPA: hypothetical protein PLI16_06155 [Bacteroidales bacterium]|nr:hypothetical protein [Bacteroidales bacterium]